MQRFRSVEDLAKAEDMLFKVPLFQNIQQQPQSFPTTEQADVFENYTYKTSWEAAGHALQPLSHAVPQPCSASPAQHTGVMCIIKGDTLSVCDHCRAVWSCGSPELALAAQNPVS